MQLDERIRQTGLVFDGSNFAQVGFSGSVPFASMPFSSMHVAKVIPDLLFYAGSVVLAEVVSRMSRRMR
jgi:hypothetical protein